MAMRETAPSEIVAEPAGQEAGGLAAAFARGRRTRADLPGAAGGTPTAAEVTRRQGLTRQAVEQRRRAGRLLALPTDRRGYAYPAWQFGPDGVLPGLAEALADLDLHSPWTRAAFLLGGNIYPNGASPLGELRRGNIATVRRAAQSSGDHAAA